MSSPHESPQAAPADQVRLGSRMRERLGDTGWTRTRAVLSLGMVFGLGAVGTMAAWSDTASATTGTFSTSAINLQMKLDGNRPVTQFTALAKTNLARGASVAGMLPVQNTGNVNFTYVAAAVAADQGTATYGSANAATFAQNLTVKVFQGGTASATACSGGTQIGTDKTLAVGSTDLVPSRPLASSASESLCFQVTLNSAAPVAARMSALSIGINFTATQA